VEIARSVGLALALLAVGTVRPSYAKDLTAANGSWNLDIAKSDFGTDTPPKSARVIIAGASTSRTWSEETVSADGTRRKESWKGAVDGRFYPIKGDPDGATFAYMKDGSIAVKDKSGKVVENTTWSLSADSKTITQHQTIHTMAGDESRTIVLRKAE
jgi:hypothetical protein